MNSREQYLKRFEMEQRAFGQVLRALPSDQLSYKPHERSTSAGDLAWQLAEEQRMLAGMIEQGNIVWERRARPESSEEIAAAYEQSTETLRQGLAQADDAKWDREAHFMSSGNVVGTSKVGDYLWGFLFDMVHHRGQLTTYIRPMGGKVPSIYGPSGDDDGSKK